MIPSVCTLRCPLGSFMFDFALGAVEIKHRDWDGREGDECLTPATREAVKTIEATGVSLAVEYARSETEGNKMGVTFTRGEVRCSDPNVNVVFPNKAVILSVDKPLGVAFFDGESFTRMLIVPPCAHHVAETCNAAFKGSAFTFFSCKKIQKIEMFFKII